MYIPMFVRKAYRSFQKSRRTVKLWMSPTITKERLVADLRALGIVEGDVVFVHSSLSNLGKIVGGPEAVIEALCEAVTSSGTIIMPAYYMVGGTVSKTCEAADTYVFDPATTPTIVGAIPSSFLRFPHIRRSIHPTHSVAALGKDAQYVTEAHHVAPSAIGPDSPWDRLVKLDGKLLGLGIGIAPVTFPHIIEDFFPDEFPSPVKTQPPCLLKCRDWEGNIHEVPVTPGNPELYKVRMDNPSRGDLRAYFRRELENVGLLTAGKVGGGTGWCIPARGYFDHLVKMMREGITVYSTPEEMKKRPQ